MLSKFSNIQIHFFIFEDISSNYELCVFIQIFSYKVLQIIIFVIRTTFMHKFTATK